MDPIDRSWRMKLSGPDAKPAMLVLDADNDGLVVRVNDASGNRLDVIPCPGRSSMSSATLQALLQAGGLIRQASQVSEGWRVCGSAQCALAAFLSELVPWARSHEGSHVDTTGIS